MGFESQASALPFLDLYTLDGVYSCKNAEKKPVF